MQARLFTLFLLVSMVTASCSSSRPACETWNDHVFLRVAGACSDGPDSHVFLENRCLNRDATATVTWRVGDQSFSSQDFQIDAGDYREIGCARQAHISSSSWLK